MRYSTYEDLMSFTEDLFAFLAKDIFGGLKFNYQNTEIDLTPPWRRISVKEALVQIAGMEPAVSGRSGKGFSLCSKDRL